jgi:hypothetical protein
MDLTTTIVLMAISAAIVVLGMWGARRKRPLGEVSLVPWNGMIFVGLVAFCSLVAHLVSLVTGVPLRGAGR